MNHALDIKQIQQAVDNANTCLYSVYPKYIEPKNIIVKFTRARSYWATITQSTSKAIGKQKDFIIKIGELFNEIPDINLRNLRLEECMIHELIHTIPGCCNHGVRFKAIANKINRKYTQYDIQTQTDGEKIWFTKI